jgi:uncharacterized membrane protein YebE (DUF533 family)
MFIHGFSKLAVAVVTLSPEKYYEIVREKDPYVGSLAGGAAGAAAGAIRGAKGKRSKSALIGAGVGAASGAAGGHVASKALKHYQTKRVKRLAEELRLRATPARLDRYRED